MLENFMEYCKRSGKEVLLTEWADAENLPLTVQSVSRGSHQKVWWRCENGHLWQSVVYARSAGSGCPYCEHKRPQPRDRMSILRGPRSPSGRKFSCGLPPGDRGRMGYAEECPVPADTVHRRKRQKGLVGLPVRTFVEGCDLGQDPRQQRLSGLHRKDDPAGLQ